MTRKQKKLPSASSETLHIKNMVCDRCISAVKTAANKAAIPFSEVRLGEIELNGKVPPSVLKDFEEELGKLGFELISARLNQNIDKIKTLVRKYVLELANDQRVNLSAYVSARLPFDYSYLSHLFSSVEGLTIEQYFIRQRIEKAKELLVYDQLNLSEIADQLGYSSVHHLSAQFKKVTGLSPTHFRDVGALKRKPLDRV